jgi:hypothetical protein
MIHPAYTMKIQLLAASIAGILATHAGVVLENDAASAQVKVVIGGEHFTTWHYGNERHLPYLWPLLAEGGVGITRNFPMGEDEPAVKDHPHHLSLYLTHGDVNGHDFWHAGKGTAIRTVDVKKGDGEGFSWIRAHHHWVAGEEIVMEEIRELRFHDTPAAARVFDMIATFKATRGDVKFGDTKEGSLSVRVAPALDGARGGVLTNAHGQQGERKVYGKPSPWMDYTGNMPGHGKRGIAIFDHPANVRRGHWHVRDYGLAALNPFGGRAVAKQEDGAFVMKNGESLTLRYRFVVHSGSHEDAGIAAHYATYQADESLKSTP